MLIVLESVVLNSPDRLNCDSRSNTKPFWADVFQEMSKEWSKLADKMGSEVPEFTDWLVEKKDFTFTEDVIFLP